MINGVRFATTSTGNGRSRPYAAAMGVIVGIAGVVGALLVATSLVQLLDDPPLWGADYDALYGNPFARTDRDLVTPVMSDPDVAGLTAATQESVAIDGADVPILAYESIRGGILPVILDGRAPSAPDEIALGRILARDLDRSINDTVTAVAVDGTEHKLSIVGFTVTPSDGGRGATMTFDALHSLIPDATRNLLLVNYRAGASLSEVQARLEKVTYTPPDTDTLPTSVRAFELVIPAAFALAIILALMVTAALSYHLASSVHRRRRDLAILRALGADRRQLRATVHWQACFVAAVGLVIGVPLGIGIGSRIHTSIANSLGVVPAVATPSLDRRRRGRRRPRRRQPVRDRASPTRNPRPRRDDPSRGGHRRHVSATQTTSQRRRAVRARRQRAAPRGSVRAFGSAGPRAPRALSGTARRCARLAGSQRRGR